MSKKIAILGCGYLGKELAKTVLAKNWEVTALTRNPNTIYELREMGVANVCQGILAEDVWHSQINPEQDFVVNCVGAASPSVEGYRESYLEGIRSIKRWMSPHCKTRFVFTSSTSVYPQSSGERVDEGSSNEGVSERGQILLDAERECLSLNSERITSFVLRLAGLYGPDRHLLINKVRAGEEMSGNGQRILNLIHRNDAANAILGVLTHSECKNGKIYNVTDNEGANREEITNWIADKLDLKRVKFAQNDSANVPNRLVSSDLIRSEIGWHPEYPSFRKAYEEMLAS